MEFEASYLTIIGKLQIDKNTTIRLEQRGRYVDWGFIEFKLLLYCRFLNIHVHT